MEVSLAQAEQFLYHEAALLDRWQLKEWVDLFAEDGEYLVPSTDTPDGDPATDLFLIFDDRFRIEQRALRLLKTTAHAEFPHSRTRRIVANVRVTAQDGAAVRIENNLVVYRSRQGKTDVFPGHCIYDLVWGDSLASHRIRRKRAVLDIDALRPQGKLSIIL
jgi:p-cumate 2,3-dioxygenase beta subunit